MQILTPLFVAMRARQLGRQFRDIERSIRALPKRNRDRLSMLTLLTPSTYLPSHFTRYLKFLYGSKRCGFTLNCAIAVTPYVGICPAICWI